MKRNPYSSRTNGPANGMKVLSSVPAEPARGVRQGQPLPDLMRVLRWGDSQTSDGDIVRVNAQSAALLPQTQRELNWPHAHIDIEHASVPGTPLFERAAKNGAFAAILGWGEPVVIDGEGLFVRGITWTPNGKRAYEFPDVSGVVKTLADGTVVALHSFAMCCHGKADGATAAFSALIDPNETEMEDELMDKLLLALLGLDASADDAAKAERAAKIGAALQALLAAGPDGAKAMSALLKIDAAKLTALSGLDKARLDALLALDADKLKALSQLSATDLEAKLKTLSQMDEGTGAALTALGKRLDKAEVDFKALSQDATATRRTRILSDAAKKGKAVPQAWIEKYGGDVQLLSDMIDGLPENVVPLDQRSLSQGTPSTTTCNPEEKQVAALFGHNPKDLPKA